MKKISERPRVLLVIRAIVIDKSKILLIQRSSEDNYKPLKWEAPGGKLDKGQDISDAVEREVFEETNLVVLPAEKFAYYDSYMIADGKYKGIACVLFYGIVKKIAGKVKLSEEHDDYKWVTIGEAYDLDLTEETRKALLVLEDKIMNLV